MSAYDELICVMRQQGTAGAPEGMLLGTMTGPTSCEIGKFKLEKDDLYISEHLLSTVASKVSIPESHEDQTTYLGPLKAGDVVLLQRLSDTEYVIIEKVVKL
uniref:DUF2577 domain-containing protein n=1 Tax=Siphoviridae sp. ctitf6 TaxID=2825627 RepID=A0A8S5P1K2_9CAUD|nr:MAG TPA: Protein of unknown function (DUF2577) [Siphoviridae sp. ctitf6]